MEVLGGEEANEDFHAMLSGGRGDVLSKEAAEAADAEGKQPLAPGEVATYRWVPSPSLRSPVTRSVSPHSRPATESYNSSSAPLFAVQPECTL